MLVPFAYSRRNLIVRWKMTLMTAFGFALVSSALIVMLSFADGIRRACLVSGDPRNVVVLVRGTNDEAFSNLDNEMVSRIENEAGVGRRLVDSPISSRELFVAVNQPSGAGGSDVLQARGVTPEAFEVHRNVRLRQGRPFRPGIAEVIVGAGLKRQLGCEVGDRLRLGRTAWTVTGVFEAGGAAFETELWCDLTLLASTLRREDAYTTVTLHVPSRSMAVRLAQRLNEGRSIGVVAHTESEYYAKQSEHADYLVVCAIGISWFMAIGAVFGVMNTMFAAIGQRRGDIAVLRILGFKPGGILISFLMESLVIAVIGGAAGILLGSLCEGFSQVTNVGQHQVRFAFRVDQMSVLVAAAFVMVMGVLGGILPAMTAMRVRPLEALR